jgi:hypothetical protein
MQLGGHTNRLAAAGCGPVGEDQNPEICLKGQTYRVQTTLTLKVTIPVKDKQGTAPRAVANPHPHKGTGL